MKVIFQRVLAALRLAGRSEAQGLHPHRLWGCSAGNPGNAPVSSDKFHFPPLDVSVQLMEWVLSGQGDEVMAQSAIREIGMAVIFIGGYTNKAHPHMLHFNCH